MGILDARLMENMLQKAYAGKFTSTLQPGVATPNFRTPWRFLLNLPFRLVTLIGYFTYGIYLWHIDAARIPTEWLLLRFKPTTGSPDLDWSLTMLFYCVLATLAGILSTRLIEQPCLKLRDRFFPNRTWQSPPSPGDTGSVPP